MKLSKPGLDVGIVTKDFERMRAFYSDLLGFVADDPLIYAGFGAVHRLAVGESVLRLFDPEKPPPTASDGHNDSIYAATGIRYITFVVDNLHEVVDACRDFGVNVSNPVRELRPGVFATTLQDPDGNWIEMKTPEPAA